MALDAEDYLWSPDWPQLRRPRCLWQRFHRLGCDPIATCDRGANGDSNNDGLQNGIAYFMNTAGLITNPGLTGNTVTWPNGGNIPAADYGTQFVVQTSPDLVTWTPVLSGDVNLSNTSGSVSYTLPSGAGKLFVRLLVTPTPYPTQAKISEKVDFVHKAGSIPGPAFFYPDQSYETLAHPITQLFPVRFPAPC